MSQERKGLFRRIIDTLTGASNSSGTLTASYKPPVESQVRQTELGEAWWRNFEWGDYVGGTPMGTGIGFTVYPFVAVWEKVWGAVPMDDFAKYKQMYTQEPFVRSTIDLHTFMAVSQGFEIEYPLEIVAKDIKAFLDRHDFSNLMKIIFKDKLIFGNAYLEVVRVWVCPQGGHDMSQLVVSWEGVDRDGQPFWWTNRLEVVAKHNSLYPDHKLENPYGEITRFVPLDPTYMRVRRDEHGTILGYAQYYVAPIVTFLADEIVHLRYSPTSMTYESVYGVSMLRPILFHQELLKNYEQIMGQVMNVYLKPMFIVKVGGDTGQEVPLETYREIKRVFETRRPATDIIIRASLPVSVQLVQSPIDRLQTTAFWLDWLHNMRTYALTVPKFFVEPAGLNRATATIVMEAYFTFINSLRQSFASQLQQDLFPKIMRSLYGEVADEIMRQFGLPKIVWKPIKEESLGEKSDVIIRLYGAGLITKNEAREALGFSALPEERDTYMTEQVQRPPPLAFEQLFAPQGEGAPEEARDIVEKQKEKEIPAFDIPDVAETEGVPTAKELTEEEILDAIDELEETLEEIKKKKNK